MSENKLPEGVGKKIVEALKKQSEPEVAVQDNTVDDLDSLLTSEEVAYQDLITEDVEESFENQESPEDELDILSGEQVIDYNETIAQMPQDVVEPDIPPQTVQAQYVQPEPVYTTYNQPQQPQYQSAPQHNAPQYQQVSAQETESDYNIPSNVAVLKRLINQLPQGVSKQTGAQIIRQTMEALGISMSTVLAEAQHFQDDLNNSINRCAASIQEYKASIKNLEKQVGDYQRQSMQVNDLISLFIMTDK